MITVFSIGLMTWSLVLIIVLSQGADPSPEKGAIRDLLILIHICLVGIVVCLKMDKP